ncbi:MAG: FAD-binding protein [Gammaproteobacteria bacterium]|nr:FAD-binding protein [Gammaproteobacteria bacterium]
MTVCGQQESELRFAADTIVVGAGLAGLSAAVEMGRGGVDVLVVEMNSMAGGHAVMAGGVAIVGTPVQENAGFLDSPDLAYEDWMEWTEDGDPKWTRFYVENSREMIYDWATELGVEFVRAAPAHANSVPRFHFTAGRAVHLVLPIYRTALSLPSVSFQWNKRAERLIVENGRIAGVVVRDLRTDEVITLRAPNVVLATGGFESDLERVLANWTPGLPDPQRLLIGAAVSATGSGHDMAVAAGAALTKMNRHYIYVNGLVSPRDPEGIRALTAGNDSSIWVNAQGERFTNEAGFDKDILVDLLNQDGSTYWAIFDENTRDDFGSRGAAWLNTVTDGHPLLDNPDTANKAQSLEELAAMAGLPSEALIASVQRFNRMVEAGVDTEFGRFGQVGNVPPKIAQPPFYAVQMFPMTRKSMGGVAIDMQGRALNDEGRVLPGLYAAGEINGSVGINGKHGMDGMFLGPALLTGRLAGMTIAAEHAAETEALATTPPLPEDPLPDASTWQASLTAVELQSLLASPRDGYWHFEMSHNLVVEREYECTLCHSAQMPFFPLNNLESKLAQTQVCTNCH